MAVRNAPPRPLFRFRVSTTDFFSRHVSQHSAWRNKITLSNFWEQILRLKVDFARDTLAGVFPHCEQAVPFRAARPTLAFLRHFELFIKLK